MDLKTKAAYHGPGFSVRTNSLEEDICEGRFWSDYRCDAEWGRLRAVQLYLPSSAISEIPDPNAVLHLAPIQYERLGEQMTQLLHVYETLGVQVHVVSQNLVHDRLHPNAMFQRDLFWQTREGAVIARMASPIRAGEEIYSSQTLANLRVPIAVTIGGNATFEGADCLWVNPSTVLCGVGKRTNQAGFEQVRDVLRRQGKGVRCLAVPVPENVQHLLGCVQVISPSRALVRGDVVSHPLLCLLREVGITPVLVRDTQEVLELQAFNFVVLDRDTVLLCEEAPKFRKFLQEHDVQVAAVTPSSELAHAAGGLACATGILCRTRSPESGLETGNCAL